MDTQLKNTIMRRVYYAYTVRKLTSPVAVHAALLLVLFFALTWFVSIPNVIRNVMHVEVGRIGGYALEALTHTEIWTLVIIGGIVLTALSLRWRLRTLQLHQTRTI